MLASDLLTRYSPIKKSEGNWGELTFAKASGTIISDGKNLPITDRRISNNDPRKHCGTHFDFISLFVSKMANVWLKWLIQNPLKTRCL